MDMTFTLRPAVRENVPLFIGLSSGTGAGKTKSAIRLATGIAGRNRKFALIDTEAGRSRHYAPLPGAQPDFVDTFNFDVLELDAPYSSARYQEAILACKNYPCIVVDQASFEHIGPGGHLERQLEIIEERVKRAREKGDKRPDWKLEEAYNLTAWKIVKHERKLLIMALLAVRVPVIFSFRAEEKMQVLETKEKGDDGREYKKTTIIAAKDRPLKERWVPICGKEFEPEMLAFFLLTRDHESREDNRGIPIPLKLNGQHKDFVDLTKPLDEEAGKRFAQWAAGAAPKQNSTEESPSSAPAPASGSPAYITADQAVELERVCVDWDIVAAFKKAAQVERFALILASDYARAKSWIARKTGAKAA
jgi:hypothetical protein